MSVVRVDSRSDAVRPVIGDEDTRPVMPMARHPIYFLLVPCVIVCYKSRLVRVTGFRFFGKPGGHFYGGYGEAVNTYDCDSYMRGFKSH